MSKNGSSGRGRKPQPGYRIEYVRFSNAQVEGLQSYLGFSDVSIIDELDQLCDDGWKISMSAVKDTDRRLISLTDKGDRPGCKGLVQCVEHSSLRSALSAIIYLAKDVCSEGCQDYSDTDDGW